MEPPAAYPESPMDQDDIAFPCKGCGEILEEGKAFELAGNRWHIDCFRCNTCGTILDSDANLLLLGDGSLICNNCTYSCSVCGNKIEDLAILTGDQAFCGPCFKCRNCKKKIENLKYARTSQGIFCMECHESLMQRRRKKNHKNGTNPRHKHLQQPPPAGSSMLLDKSLPSLPQNAGDRRLAAEQADDLPPESMPGTPGDLGAGSRDRPLNSRSVSEQAASGADMPRTAQKRPPFQRSQSTRSDTRDPSPAANERDRRDNLVPPNVSNHDRSSAYSQGSDLSGNEFIPMTLDTNPAPGPSPMTKRDDWPREMMSHSQSENQLATTKEPFAPRNHISRKATRDQEDQLHMYRSQDSPSDSRYNTQPNSPHIAYQERGRQLSVDLPEKASRKKDFYTNIVSNNFNQEAQPDPSSKIKDARLKRGGDTQPNGKFKLQEVPKHKKSEVKRNSKGEVSPPSVDTTIPSSKSKSAPVSANTPLREQQVTLPSYESPKSARSDANTGVSPREPFGSRSHTTNESPASQSSPLNNQLKSLPARGDSLAKTLDGKQPLPRREIDVGLNSKLSSAILNSIENGFEKPTSAVPNNAAQSPLANATNTRGISRPLESPFASTYQIDTPQPPLRAKERTTRHDGLFGSEGPQTHKTPTHTVPTTHKPKNESVSTLRSDGSYTGDRPTSPMALRPTEKADMSMDEDKTRTPGQETHTEGSNFLRRVSMSVRHARSYSDRGTRLSREHKWPKSPLVGSQSPVNNHEIGSPMNSSPEAKEEIGWLKNELRKERQNAVERESRLVELEAALEGKSSIKQMNTELREKRSTMVVLDTQKEIVVRELEVLTEHIAAAKKTGEPLDIGKMTNAVLREFAESLQTLKDSFSPQIEELTQQRNELIEEVTNLTQLKDQSFQEFEQLSVKNAQLADLNNQLVHQIQELYKANTGPGFESVRPPPNGLGINSQYHKDRLISSPLEQRDNRPSLSESNMTGSTAVPDPEAEPTTYLAAPQVVNIRKAQPKKFNWKKGGQNVAKGVTKGLKGAFSSDPSRGQREGSYTEGIPYAAMSQQEYPTMTTTISARGLPPPDRREGFGGFFSERKQRPQQWKNSPNGSSPAVHTAESGTQLFGSELEHRADHEKVNIPGIVMRCIQEVDARGMDIEGIYRKSGGAGQIDLIKQGFERNNDYDISDPDLDINAVTSTLKQYFRKLPTPLITYEVYDKLIETAVPHTVNPMTDRDIDPSHPAHPANPNNQAYRISSMRHAINELPPRHRDTLEVLIFHLGRVIEQQEENLMTSLNVAVVFAPTIMRPESLAREMVDTQAKNAAVQFLIENSQAIFLGTSGGTAAGEREERNEERR